MLERWRLLALLEPSANTEAQAVRSDYTDIDRLLKLKMKAWYISLLDEAQPEYVNHKNITSLCTLTKVSGQLMLNLPQGTRRVLSVRLSNWARGVKPTREETVSEVTNPYLIGRSGEPVVTMLGSDKAVISGQTDASATLAEVIATVQPTGDLYELDERAFELVKEMEFEL